MATQPTLAMIPSGYKDGKIYSVLPTDGVGDFDVTRGSNATRINKNGLIETVIGNTPRLNYPLIDGVVSGCPSLLLEPSRTNLITKSEAFDNSYWTKSGASVVGGFASPSADSPLGAYKLVEDTSVSANHRIDSQNSSVVASGSITISVILKYDGSREWVKVRDFITNAYVFFNILDNNIGNTNLVNGSQKIVDLGNDFKRVSFTYSSTSTAAQVRIYLADSGTSDGYTGDGTSGVYIFGAQLEQGSYLTSYIKSNSGSPTSRFADTANNAGNASTFNDSEGVLMAEMSALANDSINRIISLSNGSGSNRVLIKYDNSSDSIQASLTSAGSDQADLSISKDITINSKIAFKYKLNDFSLWVDGLEVDTDTSGATPVGLSKLAFDNGSGGSDFYGKTKQLQYFDTALTDSEIEKLTSWVSFRDMAQSQLYSIK